MGSALFQAAEGMPRRAFSAADVSRMVDAGILGEDERVELIEGELIEMASKYAPHEAVKNELIRLLMRALSDDVALAVEATIQLSERTIVEPDIALFPRRLFSKPKRDFLQPRRGELVLIVEVADSSLRYDKELKAALYARHGVREYWIIAAESRIAWVHKGPREDGTWEEVVERPPDEALATEALPGLQIRLDAL